MTEAEWLVCADPGPMMVFLRDKASERKYRLCSVAFARRLMPKLINDERVQKAFLIAEKFADGIATDEEREIAWQHAAVAQPCPAVLLPVALYQTANDVERVADNVLDGGSSLGDEEERAAQAALLQDIFGNPFRPVSIEPNWLRGNNATVVHLAQGAYDERIMTSGELDKGRLAILADALEDAGCTDTAILDHLRGPGPHVRGCWVVDLLLGKS